MAGWLFTTCQAQWIDPTYSVNNYKHPNKAKTAIEHCEQATFNCSGSTELTENYKHPVLNRKRSGFGTTPVAEKQENAVFNKENYKRGLVR